MCWHPIVNIEQYASKYPITIPCPLIRTVYCVVRIPLSHSFISSAANIEVSEFSGKWFLGLKIDCGLMEKLTCANNHIDAYILAIYMYVRVQQTPLWKISGLSLVYKCFKSVVHLNNELCLFSTLKWNLNLFNASL